MLYDQIPEEYRKILINASQNITPASSIIAEEIQDADTIELALINICERLRLIAFNLLDTNSALKKDDDYRNKTFIDFLGFDDCYLVKKIKSTESSDELFYIVEYEDGSKYKLSQKLIKKRK